MYNTKNISIKNWAEDDRPREKLLKKGRSALSNAELLAILIGSGSKSNSALDIAKSILNACENNLKNLAMKSVADLCKVKGVGQAKAITIISAIELSRRKESEPFESREIISSSSQVFQHFKFRLKDISHEEFWVLFLNRQNQVIKEEIISSGGVSGTVVDPKIIFKKALSEVASGIILIHNHPSGNLKPSQEDISITKTIKEGAGLLSIKVLDHVIFTDHDYFSFADQGII